MHHLSPEVVGFCFVFLALEAECISKGQLSRSKVIWEVCLLPVVVCEELRGPDQASHYGQEGVYCFIPLGEKKKTEQPLKKECAYWTAACSACTTLGPSPKSPGILPLYLYSSNDFINEDLSEFPYTYFQRTLGWGVPIPVIGRDLLSFPTPTTRAMDKSLIFDSTTSTGTRLSL